MNPLPMLHLAVCSGSVIHLAKSQAACCLAGDVPLLMTNCPPPVATILSLPIGRNATPQSKDALSRTNARLPVELYIIAVLPATKSLEESPKSLFAGIYPFCTKESRYSIASIASGLSRYVSVPSILLISPPFCMMKMDMSH